MLLRGPPAPAAAQAAWGSVPSSPARQPAWLASAATLSPSAGSLGRTRRRPAGRLSAGARAEVGSDPSSLVPAPQTRHFSRKAMRRIEREGPREADLRDEVGRIVKECLPPPADVKAPDWRALPRLKSSDFMASLRDGRAAAVELWSDRDPSVYWPPQPIHQPFAGKRALVTLKDGSHAWAELPIPELELAATAALVASEGALPYSFHQPPGKEGYTTQDLGLVAIAGGLFIFISIYLGLVRKGGIPTDTITAMEFGQSKAKSRQEGRTGVKFADVAGLGTVLGELEEVVAFLKDPVRFNTVGARPPRGLLLEGGPGTGKTLVAKAIAGEAGVPFYSMSGSEFVEVIVGVGAARVRDLFKRARVNAPCIIFVDEIDALGGARAAASMRGSEEREQTLNQLLTEMDGFTADTGVIFVGATNRADLLDPALLRPGRFDRRVTVRKPDVAARAQALRIHTRKVPLAPDVDLDAVAASLVGFSGAEVANLVNEAALCAVRRRVDAVGTLDFATAQDRVELGVVRSGAGMAPAEALRIAAHEAGHAIVAAALAQAVPAAGLPSIERVSVQPRGSEWSRTVWVRPPEGCSVLTGEGLRARLRVLLAGRAAEALVTGCASMLGTEDLADAAQLARRAVAEGMAGLTTFSWGGAFSGLLPGRLGCESGEPLDKRVAGINALRPPTGPQLARGEEEVEALLALATAENDALLRARLPAVQALAEALLAQQSLLGAEVAAILAAHPPTDPSAGLGLSARSEAVAV